MKYKLKTTNNLNEHLLQIFLTPANSEYINHQAGQYIELQLSNGEINPYSIANMPDSTNEIELHVSLEQRSEYIKTLLSDIEGNRSFEVKGPFGNCIYPNDSVLQERTLLLIAGGIGFVPFKAILDAAQKEHFKTPIKLFWGVRHASDFYYLKEIAALQKQFKNFEFVPVVSEVDDANALDVFENISLQQFDYVHEAVLKNHLDFAQIVVYASGPLAMLEAIQMACYPAGLQEKDLLSDLYDYA